MFANNMRLIRSRETSLFSELCLPISITEFKNGISELILGKASGPEDF